MKKLLAILVAAMLLFTVFACAAPATSTLPAGEAQPSEDAADASLQTVLDNGKFILGLDDSFPPMGYREDNEIKGFDIDVAREVCSRLGVELVLQPINWDTKEVELNTGNIDCIWNGMSVNAERQESMALSIPYMANAMVVVVLADSEIATFADLAGKTVGAQAGSPAVEVVEANAELRDSLGEFLEEANNVLALNELKNEQIDAVVIDKVVADWMIKGEPNTYKYLDENFGDEEYAIGFRKTDVALRDKVNEILLEMKEDGKLAEIAISWFGADNTIV